MDEKEEYQFEQVLLDAVEQAKGTGYNPQRFVGMIRSKGPFQTVKDIVASRHASGGFERLLSENLSRLTCESIIVETSWRRFFEDDLLEIAENRLTKYGVKWHRFLIAGLNSAELPSSIPNGLAPVSADSFQPPEDDQRERDLRMTHQREGQSAFRDSLLAAYGSRCCITGVDVDAVLEAAHISAYRGPASNHVENGLLLRADLHKLFDRLMLSVDPSTLSVKLVPSLLCCEAYMGLDQVTLEFGGSSARPSRAALLIHWVAFNEQYS